VLINYNVAITVVRREAGHDRRLSMMAVDGTNMYMLPVDADIQEGDSVEQTLPNGRVRTVHVTRVDVLQSPFGSSELDHTEAHYSRTPPAAAAVGATTFNVTATNVQVATGPHAHQAMTVGATTDHLVELIKGIAELMSTTGAADGVQDELHEVRDAAIAHVNGTHRDPSAVQRFARWVTDRAKTGASSAVSAAIGAAVSGLIQNVEELARTITQ
jgi:hypothetical protein